MTRRLLLAALAAAALQAQVALPKFTRSELPNGAVLLLAPKKDVPMVTVRAVFRGGLELETAETAGIGALTSELLQRGTAKRSADAFADQLDYLGARFNAGIDEQSSTVTMEFLSRDTSKALELMADAILHPAFQEAEAKKAIGEALASAKAVKDEPGDANSLYFRPFFFGEHPYGVLPDGDEITLARATRDAIVARHKMQYVGRKLILAAVGDFDSQAMKKALEEAFGSLPAGQTHTWAGAKPPIHGAPRLLIVDKPDATQTYFIIGQPGISRTDPDRTAMDLVNTLFGGRFTSLLNDALRVNSGLTYGARSTVQQDRLSGAIMITSFTKTETTVQAIDMALDVLGKVLKTGLTEEQLASAKAYVKGGFPTRHLETHSQVANELTEIELFGLNRGEIDDLFSRIDAVTLEQANRVLRSHYTAANLQFCLTGKAAAIREAVAKYATKRKEIAITAPGVQVPGF